MLKFLIESIIASLPQQLNFDFQYNYIYDSKKAHVY